MLDNRVTSHTIGFFTTGTDLEYSLLLARIVTQVAKEQNIKLINFLGGSLNPNFTFSQYKYQYQCNVAFNFAHTPHIDGLILASGILASFVDTTDFFDFYNQFSPLPMVSLGVNIPDMPSVYTNNTAIFNQLVSHLIQVHCCKKIGFISGPSSNFDAYDRYQGYLSALAENHIAYQPDYIYFGDFTPVSAQEAVKELIDERHLDLDAIVCANDSMALTVISELKKRNFSIPEKIIVTGCDDIPSSAYCVPSLTSIEQPLKKMANSAIQLLNQAIDGKPTSNVVIPSKIIFRESCGCRIMTYSSIISTIALSPSVQKCANLADNFLNKCSNVLSAEINAAIRDFIIACYHLVTTDTKSFEPPQKMVDLFFSSVRKHLPSVHTVLNLRNCMTSLKKDLLRLSSSTVVLCYLDNVFDQITHELLNYLLEYYSLQTEHLNQNFSFIRQFLLTITHNISNKEQQLQSIIPSLMECGISSCLIYLYNDGVKHNLSDTWKMPEEVYLYMGYIRNQIIDPASLPCKVPASEVATYGFLNRDELYTSCIHPIFFGNEQLGIIVFEMSTDNYSLIDNLTVELGCALKLTSTFTAQRQIENKLEALSQTDELTGLLNRRGFFNLAQDKYLFSLASHQNGILFYADMDGLKRINDTYGHSEGDAAIISMSKILIQTFSSTDIVGRIGGDEFVILCPNQDTSYMEKVNLKINQLCALYNKESNIPYTLSISIGGIFYAYEDSESLEYLLSRADKILYDKKRLKKKQQLSMAEKDHYDLI